MGVLVEEMLLLARLDQGRPLDRKPVDLSLLAAEAVGDARVVEPDRPLDLDGHGAVDGPSLKNAGEEVSATEDEQELDQPVVIGGDGPEAGVGDTPVGEGDRDRAADPDGVA